MGLSVKKRSQAVALRSSDRQSRAWSTVETRAESGGLISPGINRCSRRSFSFYHLYKLGRWQMCNEETVDKGVPKQTRIPTRSQLVLPMLKHHQLNIDPGEIRSEVGELAA